jgi:uncharacterized protein YjbI with pentapeptide repeats
MKIIKPLKLGLLFRTFVAQSKTVMGITILGLVNPGKSGSLLDSEPDFWKMIAAELGKETVLDMGMPKPHGELLVSGHYFAPQAVPVQAGQVTASFSGRSKLLYVFGDRYWVPQAGGWGISAPKPMTRMAVTWSNAFGGAKIDTNPLGKGVDPMTTPEGQTIHPLPNIESPDRLIRVRSDRPAPAGFSPLDIAWPQRMTKAGTYDRAWLNERFPDYADDMDWSIFNAAPQDQQYADFFGGREAFYFENMHSDKPRWEGVLPGLRVRCYIEQTIAGTPVFKELSNRLDTAWFFPHLEKVLLIHRALVEVADEEAEDVRHLLLACEGGDETPRGEAHYREALAKRLDEENGHLYALNEAELLPMGERSAISDLMAANPMPPSAIDKNMAKRAELEKAAAVEKIKALGLDPQTIIKAPEPQPDIDFNNLEKLPEVIASLTRQAEEKQKEMVEAARKRLEDMGLDPEKVREEARKKERRWPKFSARETIDRLRSFGIAAPSAEAEITKAEAIVTQTVRPVVHHLEPTWQPPEEDRATLRERVIRGRAEKQSLRDMDLAYVDLSGLDLSGINLSGAYLEGADFTGSNLSGADLSQAVLSRARLTDTDLTGANLSEANLGRAELSAARLSGANLASAVLAECRAVNCAMENMELTGADLYKAHLEKCDFSGSRLKEATVIEAEVIGCRFEGAELNGTVFLQCRLEGIDFSRADLTRVAFVKAAAGATTFQGARMNKLSMVGECDFSGSDFSHAVMTEANLRGSTLVGARFNHADLSGSDLSQCRLQRSDFTLARARRTQFVKADLSEAKLMGIDLMEGSFQKATLYETNIQGANLYAVDFMKVRFRNTDLRDANVKKALIERWIPKSP